MLHQTLPQLITRHWLARAIYSLFLTLLLTSSVNADPLQKLTNCHLIPTDWADGDSFLVRSSDGKEFTVRLYGADCIEWHVTDATDERRLRAQRSYFGITKTKATAKESIQVAKSYGKKASLEIKRQLSKPFTIHSSFADARGDGKHKRVYAFVITADGKDLAAHLVHQGLARAFGVYRQTYSGLSHDDYREYLRDLELQAAKRSKGVWSLTDWDALPAERQKQREEDAEAQLAFDGQKLPDGEKINPNTAARDELMRLPGIGEAFANRIIEGRPYSKPEDLLKINGVGPGTLKKMGPHLTFKSE